VDAAEAVKAMGVGGLALAPPLSADGIARLQEEIGAPLPRELRAALNHTAGIGGTVVDGIDLTGRDMDYEHRELFPLGLPIATDGAGNFWVLDLPPDEGGDAAVFFACHDPPVLLYQSPDLGHFLDQVLQVQALLVAEVRRDSLFKVWRANPGTISPADALGGDEALRAFAEELGERYTFVDLRSADVGMGFSWGRYGRHTDVRRHGHERLFACAPPERTPGLLGRLFGRTATG
jgi:SMI1/KNR4 family protein SUKH-1